MLEDIIQRAADGIDINGTRAYAKNVRACSIMGTQSLEVYLKDGPAEERVFCAAFFPGREPFYRPWIDIFCIKDILDFRPLGRGYYDYYDSAIEDALLGAFSGALGPGQKIFIEYYSDRETSYGLAMGIPPVLSRQGYKLFNLGFTWFKDWYFSEGGHEGGQKLQGEKPLNKIIRKKHLMSIREEVRSFIEKNSDEMSCIIIGDSQKYLLRAKERAEKLLASIDAELEESHKKAALEKATLVSPGCSL